MKQSNKGFDYSYNAQAVVDIAEQIIVAAETTNEANDKQQAVPMAQAALDNLNAAGIEQPKAADGTPAPIPNTADTGYFSKEAVEELEKMGIDPHIATGRQKHHEAPVPPEAAAPSAEAAAPSAEASAKEKMHVNCVRRLVKLSTRCKPHRRAGIRHDQVRARNPQVSVARPGESVGRVATDMLDPQSFEDLAPLLQRRGRLRGIVRAQGWAEAEKAKAQRNPAAMREHEQIFGCSRRFIVSHLISVTCGRQTEWPAFRHKSLLKSNLRRTIQYQPPGIPEEPCTFVGLYPR